MVVSRVICGEVLYAPQGECPADCPFYREEPSKEMVCHFRCVKAEDCGSINPETNIADKEGKYCRACKVPGCDQCSEGGVDKCARCDTGYILNSLDGQCYSAMWIAWDVIFAVVGIVGALLLAWYVDLRRRPIVNVEGLQEGLSYRSRLKLHMPKSASPPGVVQAIPTDVAGRALWPLSTSLIDVDVAGLASSSISTSILFF
jgi:hypothetical protein